MFGFCFKRRFFLLQRTVTAGKVSSGPGGGVGCGGGRVQGDQRSASLPGHTQCGNRWGVLRACLSSPPAWARAWGQMTRWSDGQEVGVFRRIPGCQAWGRSFLAALVLPDPSSHQYLCKCSQLGKMQSAADLTRGRGKAASGGCSLVASLKGKAGVGPRGWAGAFHLLRDLLPVLHAPPPPPPQPVSVTHTHPDLRTPP